MPQYTNQASTADKGAKRIKRRGGSKVLYAFSAEVHQANAGRRAWDVSTLHVGNSISPDQANWFGRAVKSMTGFKEGWMSDRVQEARSQPEAVSLLVSFVKPSSFPGPAGKRSGRLAVTPGL